MKWMNKIRIGLLVLSMLILTAGQSALASDEAYTYTVRLYAGNQGILTGQGIDAPGASIEKVANGDGKVDQIVISGVKYGDTVYIYPNEAAKVTDDHYYIRGIRRSGRDNSEAVASTGAVGADMDYVIAYGVSGEMTAYTVNYQDTAGNTLLPSDTYYGNIGERQYVSSRYVDGYQPQAYNLVMTLSSNSAENVFNFIYTPTETPAAVTPAATPETPAATTPAATPAPAADAGAAGADAGTADAGAAGADAGTEDTGVGGDVTVPDDAVPQANVPEDTIDLDDEEVPLADSIKAAQPGTVMGYLPVYIGIGVAAVLALAGTAFYLRKRRKAAMIRTSRQTSDDEM